MIFRRCLGALLMLICFSATAQAAGKVALVIGNSAYQKFGALKNPSNDAADLSRTFERLGFEVTTAFDLSYGDMRQALGRFSDAAVGSEMAVIFYAGHSMEIDKQNYLIPVDAQLKTERAISYEAIPLDLVTEAVSGSAGLKLVILDACRDNPFAAAMEMTNRNRSIGRGLARIEPAAGTLVAYSAKEGTVAADGTGRNSPYAKALIEHLERPGVEIDFLFRLVRDAVMKDTENRQQPFTYGSLPAVQIYFKPGQAGALEAPATVQQQPEPPARNDAPPAENAVLPQLTLPPLDSTPEPEPPQTRQRPAQPAPSPAPAPAPTPAAVVCHVDDVRPPDDWLALRTDPTTRGGRQIRRLRSGTRMEMLGPQQGYWYLVRTDDGSVGWVSWQVQRWIACW